MRSHFWLGIVGLVLAGCYPTVDHRGFNPEEIQVDKIKINKSTQENVQDILGSPSTISLFPVEGKKEWSHWYYVYRKTETTSFFTPKVVDQVVIKVTFDDQGIVRRFEQQKGVQGEKIKPSKERTATTGYESSAMRDVFGGFGKGLSSRKEDK